MYESMFICVADFLSFTKVALMDSGSGQSTFTPISLTPAISPLFVVQEIFVSTNDLFAYFFNLLNF